jgi:hypothetical protein
LYNGGGIGHDGEEAPGVSQQYRRVAFADFLRDATRIFDGIETRGETILVERGGKTFVITAWQAHRRRTKPQPPNMQDSLWAMGGHGVSAEPANDADAKRKGVADAPVEREPRSRSEDGSKSPS